MFRRILIVLVVASAFLGMQKAQAETPAFEITGVQAYVGQAAERFEALQYMRIDLSVTGTAKVTITILAFDENGVQLPGFSITEFDADPAFCADPAQCYLDWGSNWPTDRLARTYTIVVEVNGLETQRLSGVFMTNSLFLSVISR